MSDAWPDWARLTAERDAALAQVEKLEKMVEYLITQLDDPMTDQPPIGRTPQRNISELRAALQGDGA
jgi:hypothetical protein